MKVQKRNGTFEELDYEKIHTVVKNACEGLSGVSYSDIVLNAKIQFADKIKTEKIHELIINSAAELISEDHTNYQYVAARLLNYQIRKQVFGSEHPHTLKKQIDDYKHFYHDDVYKYNDEELEYLNNKIDHSRDNQFAYIGLRTYIDKYCLQDRAYKVKKSKRYIESPQLSYMILAMYAFSDIEDRKERLEQVVELYDVLSLNEISLPTPVMAGCRTKRPQNSSCVKVDVGDSLDGIFSANHVIAKYIAAKAGLGINIGKIRAANAPVRNGEAVASGIVPYIRCLQTTVKSTTQSGVRGGSATLFLPIWHHDVEDFLVMKNNRGTEFNRARHLDYAVSWNNYLLNRAIKKQEITLFSPHEVPDLYNAFFSKNKDDFIKLYEKYEKQDGLMKRKIDGYELLSKWIIERFETSRIYYLNVDNANQQSPFLKQIEQSNLCMEILIPNAPFESVSGDDNGEIALCTLAGINLGIPKIKSKIPKLMKILVNLLNHLLIKQDYESEYARKNTQKYNPLGIGVINYAYFLAKNYEKYGSEGGLELTHEIFESMYYHGLKSSVEFAKKYGKCTGFEDSIYFQGKTLLDTYNKNVDSLVDYEYKQDWDTLKKDIKEYGLRNITLLAQFPAETSAKISNATFGVEPIRSIVISRKDQDTVENYVVPEANKLKNWYDNPFARDFTKRYIKNIAVMQKYMCQSISANTYYDPTKYENEQVPISEVIYDVLYATKYGLKTLYYSNIRDVAGEAVTDESCESCVV